MRAPRTPVAGTARNASRGVTLIELVIVMALMAILVTLAAIAVREPMQAYASTASRAQLTDIADTALRRMGRDVRLALPNSLRVTVAGSQYMEMLEVRMGGRYRTEAIPGNPAADTLDFTAADTTFNILGAGNPELRGDPSAVPDQVINTATDFIVVRNESATATRSNAYTYRQAAFNCTSATAQEATCNSAKITVAPVAAGGGLTDEFKITFESRLFNYDAAAKQGFPSPGNRFYVVSGPVTYVCAPNPTTDADGNATGTLTRWSGYTVQFAQPTGGFAGGTQSLVASHVAQCQFIYDDAALGNLGLVQISLTLVERNESVNLYHEIHINNAP
jgi:MSHA biogenesis protein MshO